ncbi:MAG TPA: hypothetical protein VFP56_12940 [Candidatus Limnocylindrales bacterium]|nr:hypothetical protein [Candidatus Limnocylindrales bacterium]
MRRALAVLSALGALTMAAAPVAAVTVASATIDVHSVFEAGTGTFTADSAVLCDSGTTSDTTQIAGNGRTLTFHNLKTFECDDGSGTFTLRIQARYMPCDSTDSGVWTVAGGTGAYEGLLGSGSLVGTYFPNVPCEAEGIDDHLIGVLRLP